jgi:dihydroorotate dehydrogenase
LNGLETVVCGKRLENFLGNAAGNYTGSIWKKGNEIKDYELFSELVNQHFLGFVTTPVLSVGGTSFSEVLTYPFEMCNVPTIASIRGKDKEETRTVTKYLNGKVKNNPNIFAVEFSPNCPGDQNCPSCYRLGSCDADPLDYLSEVVGNIDLPVLAKINFIPEREGLIEFGKKIEEKGVRGVVAVNPFPENESNSAKHNGVERKIKNFTLNTIKTLHDETKLDLIGVEACGYSDALSFLRAGAKAVEPCSKFTSVVKKNGAWTDISSYPWQKFLEDIGSDVKRYMERRGLKSLEEIIGNLQEQ